MKYVHLDDAGQIDEGPGSLPKSWRNVSGLDLGTPEDLAANGWYEFIEDKPNEALYDLGTPVDTVENTTVRRTYPAAVLKSDEVLRDVVRRKLENLRYTVEVGGTPVPGIGVVPTGRDDRSLIKRAAEAISGPPDKMPFKLGRGNWKKVDKNDMDALWPAVVAHVRACFDNEEAHDVALSSLSGQAILDYDISTGWPPNEA